MAILEPMTRVTNSLGHQHFSRSSEGHHSRPQVDGETYEIVPLHLHFPGVKSGPDVEPTTLRGGAHCEGTSDSRGGRVEDGE